MTSATPSPGDAPDQPTRGAKRNQHLADHADQGSEGSVLPSLDTGITILDVEGGRGVPALQSLVVDHLLGQDGPAFWVDACGHATTTTLARLAPSRRLLDRIHVARGFTAPQHYGAVCDLPSDPPALVVAPALDAQYRDDALGPEHAKRLLTRVLARLRACVADHGVPVLVTRSERDEFTAPVTRVADHHLVCEQTRMGPRFVGEEFETLVYPVDDGAYYQTTVAYWQQLLAARATRAGREPASPDTGREHASGVTADDETARLTADPLRDARLGVNGRRGR